MKALRFSPAVLYAAVLAGFGAAVNGEVNSSGASQLPTVDVTLTVTEFADLTQTSAVLGHRMTLNTTGSNVSQHSPNFPDDWLHVRNGGAILKFKIDSTDNDRYTPIGAVFSRHDVWPEPNNRNLVRADDPFSIKRADLNREASKNGSWQETSPRGLRFPFSGMKIVGDTLEITNRIMSQPGARKAEKIYKFSIIIRRQRDGAIGVIDPFIHNED